MSERLRSFLRQAYEHGLARAQAEEAEAQRYAEFIRRGNQGSWHTVNQGIIDRYSRTALYRIKRRAWAIVEGRTGD